MFCVCLSSSMKLCPYAFHNKRFQTLFIDQLARSMVACPFKTNISHRLTTWRRKNRGDRIMSGKGSKSGGLSPEGVFRWNRCTMPPRNMNSSIFARFSPRQTRRPTENGMKLLGVKTLPSLSKKRSIKNRNRRCHLINVFVNSKSIYL